MSATIQSDTSFLLMKQWREQIELLNDSQKAQLLTAIYNYQCDNEDLKTDDGMLKMLWSTIRQTFEYNNKKYSEKCAKNRENAQRRYSKSSGSNNHSGKDKPSFDLDELEVIR